jgi:hypothetical protein
MPRDFGVAFTVLREILRPHEDELVKVHDTPEHYYLDAPHVMANGKPLFFGAVRTSKRYVGFHLMPVYVWPELLDDVSEDLRRRMQGKSCFNFTSPDPRHVDELDALTRLGLERYRQAGYLGRNSARG